MGGRGAEETLGWQTACIASMKAHSGLLNPCEKPGVCFTIASLSDREKETGRVLGSRASQSNLVSKVQVPAGESVSQSKVDRLLRNNNPVTTGIGRWGQTDRQYSCLLVCWLLSYSLGWFETGTLFEAQACHKAHNPPASAFYILGL